MTNIMQMIPVSGSVFEDLPLVSNIELNEMRKECEVNMKQMYHCRQCRADAIGTLSEDCSIDFRNIGCSSCHDKCSDNKLKKVVENAAKSTKYKFAVSSKSGINIDQHFGHASEFYIYTYDDGTTRFLEKRNVDKYCTGVYECDEHENKMEKTMKAIGDCNAVLALRVGAEPTEKLEKRGIKVIEMYDSINKGIVKAVKILGKDNVHSEMNAG